MSQVLSVVGSWLSHQRPLRGHWGLSDSLKRETICRVSPSEVPQSYNHLLSTPSSRCSQLNSAHDFARGPIQSEVSLSWAGIPALPGLQASSLAPSRPAKAPSVKNWDGVLGPRPCWCPWRRMSPPTLDSQGLDDLGLCSTTYSLSKLLSGTQFLCVLIENNSLSIFF